MHSKYAVLFPVLLVCGLLLPGCGLGKRISDAATRPFDPKANDIGIAREVSVTVPPRPGQRTLFSVPAGLRPAQNAVNTGGQSEIVIRFKVRADREQNLDLHVRELATPLYEQNGQVVFSEGSMGCRSVLVSGVVNSIEGSCVESTSIVVPQGELPRNFLNTTPLFAGPIVTSDLVAVFQANPFSDGDLPLLSLFIRRLAVDEKALAIQDVSSLLFDLGSDAARLDAVNTVKDHILDPANAESLDARAFTDPSNWRRAVQILKAVN